MKRENLDIVVIGSGSGGYVSAIRASQLGYMIGQLFVEEDIKFESLSHIILKNLDETIE